MALQVDDTLAVDCGQLRFFDAVEMAVSGAEGSEVVAARADMDADTLVPVCAIDAAPLGFGHRDHVMFRRSKAASGVFRNTASKPKRKPCLTIAFRCSMRRASASAVPKASTNTSIRCI